MSDQGDDVQLDPQIVATELAKIKAAEAAVAAERKKLSSAFNKAKKSFQDQAGRLSRKFKDATIVAYIHRGQSERWVSVRHGCPNTTAFNEILAMRIVEVCVKQEEASLSGKQTIVQMREMKTPQGGAGLDETLRYAQQEGWLSTQQMRKIYEISEALGGQHTKEGKSKLRKLSRSGHITYRHNHAGSDIDVSDSDSGSDEDAPAPRAPTIRHHNHNASTTRRNVEDEEPAKEGAATDLAQNADVLPDGSIPERFLPEEEGDITAVVGAPSASGIGKAEQAASVALPSSAVEEPPIPSKIASQDSMDEIVAAGAGLRSDALPAPRLPVQDLGPKLQQQNIEADLATEIAGNARRRRVAKRMFEDSLTGEELEKTLNGIDAFNNHAGFVQDNADPNRRKTQLELTTEEVNIFRGIIEKCHKQAFLASGGKQPTGYAGVALNSIWNHYMVDTHPADHERVKAIVITDAWIRNNLKRFFGKDFNGRNDFKHVQDFIAAKEARRSEHSAALQLEAGLGLGAPGPSATGQACFEWIESFKETQLKVDNGGTFTCISDAITTDQVGKLYDRVTQMWLPKHGTNS